MVQIQKLNPIAVVTDCPACTEATANAWLAGSYRMDRPSCQARQFAHSPAARDAHLGYPEALQAAMRTVWSTPEKYRQGRLEVYRWAKLIEDARQANKEQR